MTTVDRILDVIDAGLQTPAPDPTFGEVSPTVHDRCVRCQTRPPAGGDFCGPCRAFLLGDDPPEPRRHGGSWVDESHHWTPEQIQALNESMRLIGEQLVESWRLVSDTVTRSLTLWVEAVEPWLPPETWERTDVDPVQRARARRARPEVCPRHGPAPAGLCRRCAR